MMEKYRTNNKNLFLKWLKKSYKLLTIVLVGAFFRIFKLGFQEPWLDELHTLKEANPALSFQEFHQVIMWREAIPHFYFLVVRLISELFEHTIFSVRMVSAVCGIVTIIMIFYLGKELYSKKAGYIAALLTSFHPFLIEYSQEGRSYAMLAMFVVIAFYFLVKLLKKETFINAFLLGLFSGFVLHAQPLGIVNIASIYLVLIIFVIVEKNSKLFKLGLFSGVLAIIIASPVTLIFLKLLGGKGVSTWIPSPTVSHVISALSDISGYSFYLLLLYLFAFCFFSSLFFFKKKKKIQSKIGKSYIILSVWALFFILFLVLKSKEGSSLILHRYFISIIPAFIMIMTIALINIPNKIIRYIIFFGILLYNGYTLFFSLNYYTKYRKSQFYSVYEEINKTPHINEKKISNWGWLLNYYFKAQNTPHPVVEKTLENHIQEMESKKEPLLSFWYIDGNSRPFALSEKDKTFLNTHFILENKIIKHDAWAYYYETKHKNYSIHLKKFKPALFDGTGALIFVQNQKSIYPKFPLEKGNYTITIFGKSLPEKPINNENAHFVVYNNKSKLADFYLSNNQDAQPIQFSFMHKGGNFSFILEYDNDIVINGEDRNAIIQSIVIKKQQ